MSQPDPLLHEFCSTITGVASVSDRMAEAAAAFVRAEFDEGVLDSLLETFATSGLPGVQSHAHAAVARAMTYFLYTGVSVDARAVTAASIDVEENYFEALLPRVIQAHPRGLTGGYFGHWHYPPEDSDA